MFINHHFTPEYQPGSRRTFNTTFQWKWPWQSTHQRSYYSPMASSECVLQTSTPNSVNHAPLVCSPALRPATTQNYYSSTFPSHQSLDIKPIRWLTEGGLRYHLARMSRLFSGWISLSMGLRFIGVWLPLTLLLFHLSDTVAFGCSLKGISVLKVSSYQLRVIPLILPQLKCWSMVLCVFGCTPQLCDFFMWRPYRQII